MTPNLSEALKIYCQDGTKAFMNYLGKHSNPTLVGMLSDLMTIYLGDANSSTLREVVTTAIAGYERSSTKLGYNGRKTIAPGKVVACEVKPKNVRALDPKNRRLDGGGSFNDYTWARLEKDRKENPNILVSGFVDGRLIYIFEFPFTTKTFIARLQEQLERHLPDGDREGQYVRSAGFSWITYIDDARLIYRTSDLAEFRKYITGGVRENTNGFYKHIAEATLSEDRAR